MEICQKVRSSRLPSSYASPFGITSVVTKCEGALAERILELEPSTIWDLHALCIINISGWVQGPLIHSCPLPHMLWLHNKIFKRFSKRSWNHKKNLVLWKKKFLTQYFWSEKKQFFHFYGIHKPNLSQRFCGDWRICSKRSVLLEKSSSLKTKLELFFIKLFAS